MQKMNFFAPFVAVFILVSHANFSHAALIDRGNGLIFDTDLNITWLQDANLAASNTFGAGGIDPDGGMNWNETRGWIAAMNATEYLGFSGWRMPAGLNQDGTGPCNGYNCIESEMGHLFYIEFGAEAYTSVLDTGNPAELAKFKNIQSGPYWHGWEFIFPADAFDYKYFNFNDGIQDKRDGGNPIFGWVVHDGDIGAVPIPPTFYLFSSGLVGFISISRKRQSHPKVAMRTCNRRPGPGRGGQGDSNLMFEQGL